nr:hypothetical protein [Tanacetum cinerariifolium]
YSAVTRIFGGVTTTPPTPIATPTPTTTVVAAPRLSAATKGVPDVPSDDSEEELSWNSSDDEDVDEQTKDRDESEGNKTNESDDDDQDEAKKVNDDDDNEEEGTKYESFDPIPWTPEESEDDDNNEEDQGLRIGEEERMQEEDEADELYRDVDIKQGRGLQVSQETEDSH